MAKTNKYESVTFFGVAKTSFDSSRRTWDEEKTWEYAYMITSGLSSSTFFPESNKVFDTKDEAQRFSYDVREWARYDRERSRYGYCHYKDRIWIHEFVKKPGYFPAYLPSVGEIKKGMDYIHNELMNEEKPRAEYVEWATTHEGMTAAQVRDELIENYLK